MNALALATAAAFLAPLLAQDAAHREGSIRREVQVGRIELDATVTGPDGSAIPDLTTEDFKLFVDGRAVALESVEWIPADKPEAELEETVAAPASTAAPDRAPALGPAVRYPPGRLLVFFFQTNYHKLRLTGLVRMGIYARKMLRDLLPTDQVAVVSFDSHLKLRQDFTSDRLKIERATFEAIKFGEPPEPERGGFPSLGTRWDVGAARRATSVEQGLTLTARAMEGIGGAKTLFFFGWGLMVARSPGEGGDLGEAVDEMARARVSFNVLDVTEADYHTLETPLIQIADLGGGQYFKTHLFPQVAISRMTKAMAGRYVLVFSPPSGKRGAHEVKIELAGRKGHVFHRPYYVD